MAGRGSSPAHREARSGLVRAAPLCAGGLPEAGDGDKGARMEAVNRPLLGARRITEGGWAPERRCPEIW